MNRKLKPDVSAQRMALRISLLNEINGGRRNLVIAGAGLVELEQYDSKQRERREEIEREIDRQFPT